MHALVTGGGGFLGRAITEQLLARGDRVTILSRGRYPEVEALGAAGVQCDLSSPGPELAEVLAQVDVVFHVASKTGVWGSRESFFQANVTGTQNLVVAAKKAGVKRFVYTSSPSATFDGGDAEGKTEGEAPYPDHFEAPYPESKAVAEKFVLEQNTGEFYTTALRPHLIWGPRDPHILPRLISRRKQGRLMRIGDGSNKVGITFIDNAAVADLQAADTLASGAANAGKAYFITDLEPVLLWPWIDGFLKMVDVPPISRSVSPGVALFMGGLLEWIWRIFGRAGEPPMTRFVAAEMATSHWYDLTGARTDFGYTPLVGPDEGLERAAAFFKAEQAAGRL